MMAQQAAYDMPESVRPQEVVARVFATLSVEHLTPWERGSGRYSSSTWWLEDGKAIFVHVDELDVDAFYQSERFEGLRAAGEWAAKVGVQWLHFDVDGPIQPGLPRWNDAGERIPDEPTKGAP